MRKNLYFLFILLFILSIFADCKGEDQLANTATILGNNVYIFHGLPKTWGENSFYKAKPGINETRTMNGLGGMPLVDVYNENGGIAFFNTSAYLEPFTVKISSSANSVTVTVSGGTSIERFEHKGDYYDAIREYATRMKAKGIILQTASNWAYDPIWETYGFEEDFDLNTIRNLLPVMKTLGIKTITFDSGWYGIGRGSDFTFHTGDFLVNPNIIGTEQEFIHFIAYLHTQGFRVRVWWVPGVAEKETTLYSKHPDWFYAKVKASTGETSDYYLDPTKPEVQEYQLDLVKRFIGYGVDGFKQDDVYNIISPKADYQKAYEYLFKRIYTTATQMKNDFAINTCNCGIVQNFYVFPGENQIITSDPVGSRQFRARAKYLHALNINGAAILGDHVELTRGDVGPEELKNPAFYNTVDFASSVPLGMVLETKFRIDPGQLYRTWFAIYNTYKFYEMEWINIPYFGGIETYLLRKNGDLYFSFFAEKPEQIYSGTIQLSHLEPGRFYTVRKIVDGSILKTFTATGSTHVLDVTFTGSLVLNVE